MRTIDKVMTVLFIFKGSFLYIYKKVLMNKITLRKNLLSQ